MSQCSWRNNVVSDYYDVTGHSSCSLFDKPRVNPTPNHPKRKIVKSLLLDLLLIFFGFAFSGLFYFIKTPSPYFRLDDPRYIHPIQPEVVSSLLMGIINWLLPLLLLIMFEIFLFGMYKWNMIYVIKGYAETMVLSLLVACFIWAFYPGLRPNFYAVCDPDPTRMTPVNGFYTTAVCRNSLVQTDLDGFPSGHASTAWAAWTYVSFYFWARLKPFDDTSHFWKIYPILFIPIGIVIWESTTRITEHWHSVTQVVWGSIIGILSAFIGYRLNHLGYPWHPLGHITTGMFMAKKASVLE